MIKNRFFSSTIGQFAELIIAAKADDSGAAVVQTDSQAIVPITVSATPTAADTITITVDGIDYKYTVPAAATNQQVADQLNALLNANNQGFRVAVSGTTALVLTFGAQGSSFNTKTISLVKVGTTFTVAGPYTFTGGVDTNAVGQDTLALFIANAANGAIWAFWTDTNVALAKADTQKASNQSRKFYYAWKQSDGTLKRSADIPVAGMVYDSKPFNAGQVSIQTLQYGGTVAQGQYVHFKVIETTGSQLPYPVYEYVVQVGASGINQACTDLVAQVAKEPSANDIPVSVTASTNTLTVTGLYKNRSFKVQGSIEVTTAQPSDLSTIVATETQKLVYPIGDVATVKLFETYSNENYGANPYTQSGILPSELGQPASNLDASGATQYGFVQVTSLRIERSTSGVRGFENKAYVVIAVRTADVATLAAL